MEQQTNRIFSSRIRLDILFMIFLIMQPLIDIYRTFLGDTLSIGPFAIEEIFILLFLFFLLIASSIQIFQNKTAKKVLPYLFYLLITACYLILHCLNMLQFDQTIYSASDINIVVEIYYIFRAYLCPILLSILIFQNGVSDALFFRTMKIIVCIISGIIVVTNLLGISLVAYSTEKKQIAGSIFSWPSLSIDMMEIEIEAYTSKGWFESANQIGALLFSLCPFTILCAFKKTVMVELPARCFARTFNDYVRFSYCFLGIFISSRSNVISCFVLASLQIRKNPAFACLANFTGHCYFCWDIKLLFSGAVQ